MKSLANRWPPLWTEMLVDENESANLKVFPGPHQLDLHVTWAPLLQVSFRIRQHVNKKKILKMRSLSYLSCFSIGSNEVECGSKFLNMTWFQIFLKKKKSISNVSQQDFFTMVSSLPRYKSLQSMWKLISVYG